MSIGATLHNAVTCTAAAFECNATEAVKRKAHSNTNLASMTGGCLCAQREAHFLENIFLFLGHDSGGDQQMQSLSGKMSSVSRW